ncbi:hypothetical protein AMTRI_Chr03g148900 [Amborella trichopoda]|uniref:FRIGIDA-like protein n=1 Tax=Amborella trichopoda TaxID=13333 RepID=W1NDH0_AMBTC|nr:FRIGIDA-like protein 4a [Amborella trichopoda]ERM93512.1 hypothetical protein AMTR_s00004p00045050 [Amborella trichopoda]|eukprot:XP_006826275.1 FRIGIDA-like protein 4a [Amborella trichopoda]
MATDTLQLAFQDLDKQRTLITNCTLLWKDLSHHFSSLEQHLQEKSQTLDTKSQTLDQQTQKTLEILEQREQSINYLEESAVTKLQQQKEAALLAAEKVAEEGNPNSNSDSNDRAIESKLRGFCQKMDSKGLWDFIVGKKKDIELVRTHLSNALLDCIDPSTLVLRAIEGVFPVDRRPSDREHDQRWACILLLELLVPILADPIVGPTRPVVTPKVRDKAKGMAKEWKEKLDSNGGVDNVKSPEVHTFLQHLVTFGITSGFDSGFLRDLLVAFAWRKQMPKLAVLLGLKDRMPDIIEELVNKGKQVDAVHFIVESGLIEKYPPVPLLEAYLRNSREVVASILKDGNNSTRAMHEAGIKEHAALRAVIKCVEEHKLESNLPLEPLQKRLAQIDKLKAERKKAAASSQQQNKRGRVGNGAALPPAKAGRLANSHFPARRVFVRSPNSGQSPQFPAPPPPYNYGQAYMGGNRSPTSLVDAYGYPPENAAPLAGGSYGLPENYGGYANYGMYQASYFR